MDRATTRLPLRSHWLHVPPTLLQCQHVPLYTRGAAVCGHQPGERKTIRGPLPSSFSVGYNDRASPDSHLAGAHRPRAPKGTPPRLNGPRKKLRQVDYNRARPTSKLTNTAACTGTTDKRKPPKQLWRGGQCCLKSSTYRSVHVSAAFHQRCHDISMSKLTRDVQGGAARNLHEMGTKPECSGD
jgi:hypothetical protein